MRFDVYGRYELDVERHDGRWVAYRRGEGTRRRDPTVLIPADATQDELATVLEDLLHELGRPGGSIRRID